MRQIFATAFLIAASAVPAFAEEPGEPRYFVKAWLQKADRTFDHTTGWCDGEYDCLVPIAEHAIELRNLSGSVYSLTFLAAPSEQENCCVTRTGSPTLNLWSGHPRVVPLYYTPKSLGDSGRIPFGRLIIAVEYLGRPNSAPEPPRL